MRKKNIWLLLGLLLFSLVFISVVRFAYPSAVINPYEGEIFDGDVSGSLLHIDEWQHVAQGKYIAKHGFGINPYTREAHQEREWGFHLFLALFEFVGLDLLVIFPYLSIFFFVLNTFFVYYFAHKLLHSEIVAFVSGLLFILLPANANLLGNWFLVPLTFSLWLLLYCVSLIPDFFIRLERHQVLDKNNYIFVLLSLLLFVLYPIAAVLLFFVFLILLFIEKKFLFRYWKIFLSGSLVLLVFIVFVLFYWLGFHWNFSTLSGTLIFPAGWISLVYHNIFFLVLGVFNSILFFLGVYYLICKISRIEHKLIFSFFVFFIIESVLYYLFGFSLFLPYVRLLYYALIFFTFVAACTCLNIFSLKNRWQNILYYVLIIILLLSNFVGVFTVSPNNFSLQQLFYEEDIALLSHVSEDSIVLADPFFSNVITPVSGAQVVAMISANLPSEESPYFAFVQHDCSVKYQIALYYEVDYVISEYFFNCPGFEQVLGNGRKILYRFNQVV